MVESRQIWAFAVMGNAEAEFLVTSNITLPEPAAEITEVAKTVLIDRADAVLENLIIEGRLRLRWVYAASPKLLGAAQPLVSSASETPFAVRVSASTATPEMECIINQAHVQDGRVEIIERSGHGSITALRDHSILVLTARYGKHEQSTICQAPGSVVPLRPHLPVISYFGTRRRQ